MRWVAFWSLLYVAVLEFLFAVLFLSAAWSKFGDGPGRGLWFAVPVGLAATGVFLLLRHLWAYVLSVLLGLGVLGVAVKVLLDYFLQPLPEHGGRGLGLDLGLIAGAPALLAVVLLALPPTWREVGLDHYFARGE